MRNLDRDALERRKKLMMAVKSNDFDSVKQLCNSSTIRPKYLIGPHYIELAANNDNLAMVKYLVENGGKINRGVVAAAFSNNLPMVKYLITSGGKTTYSSIRAYTYHSAIDGAAYNSNLLMAKYLVEEKGVIVTDTAIDYAVEENNGQMLKYLVENDKVGEISVRAIKIAMAKKDSQILIDGMKMSDYLLTHADKSVSVQFKPPVAPVAPVAPVVKPPIEDNRWDKMESHKVKKDIEINFKSWLLS